MSPRAMIWPLALIFATTAADARSTDPLEKWWNGLDAASTTAPARGVVMLRAPVRDKVHFTGGRFIMGSTPPDLEEALDLCRREIEAQLCEKYVAALLFETVAHMVTLSPFAIDRTEVSVGAYDKCVQSGACLRAQFPLGDVHFDHPNFPVTFVSWENARVYCAFVGGRLPTEAEWEFAARGENRRIFPWGNVYNPHLANHGALFGSQTTDATDGYELLAPVDAFFDGATPEGVLQMAGNVSEWVFDFFASDLSGFGYAGNPVTNPKGPPTGLAHLVRGGSYAQGATFLRAASRSQEWSFAPDVGFRCAYD
jgi:sulfatase modifying factor 1